MSMRASEIGVILLLTNAILLPAFSSHSLHSSSADKNENAKRRHPIALVLTNGGQRLYVANQRSGTISVIDLATQKVEAERVVARSLSSLAAAPDGCHLVGTDDESHEVILIGRDGTTPTVLRRVEVSRFPVQIRLSADGASAFVISLWSAEVTKVAFTPPLSSGAEPIPQILIEKTRELPFAPGQALLTAKDQKLIVTDAFGGRLAVLNTGDLSLDSVRALPAHNIRGLALSHDEQFLLLGHQNLSSLAQTTRDDVHWGNLLTNNLRKLKLERVLAAEGDILREGRTDLIGDVGHGAGDPSGLTVTQAGRVILALGGTNEIAWRDANAFEFRRVKVGRRPTAVVASADGRFAYVANTFADSISVVDLDKSSVHAEIALGPTPPQTSVDRGEMLFFDANRSLEGWFSCHSCHTDGHTNGRLNDNLGDGSFGAPKRVLSLRGVKDTGPYAWNGSVPDLNSQIRKSIETTMHGPKLDESQVRDLAAFVGSLRPPPPRKIVDEATRQRGRLVFEQHGCDDCHAPTTYTSPKTYHVGLADEEGRTAFNPPSLRGVSQGGPYFHDNRAATLEDVFLVHKHQLKNELSKDALQDLLSFLRNL